MFETETISTYCIYLPVFFEAHHLEDAPWADPALGKSDFDPKFNQIDGKIDRKSHEGKYKVICSLTTRLLVKTFYLMFTQLKMIYYVLSTRL